MKLSKALGFARLASSVIKPRVPSRAMREQANIKAKDIRVRLHNVPDPFKRNSKNPSENWNIDGWSLGNGSLWLNYDDEFYDIRIKWNNATGMILKEVIKRKTGV